MSRNQGRGAEIARTRRVDGVEGSHTFSDAVDAAPRSRDADKNLMSSDMLIWATKIGMKPSSTPWNGGTTIKSRVDQIRTLGGFSNIVVKRTDVHRMTLIRMVRKPAMKKIIRKTFSSNANQTINSI